MKVVAVTACPVGIAHTYLAAEQLAKVAKELGIIIKVETQGSIGVENQLTEADIAEADVVLIAADKGIDTARFAGKKLLVTGVAEAVHKPKELLGKLSGDIPVYMEAEAKSGLKSIEDVKNERKARQGTFYRSLMNGVSHMIPFVVVGGLLIALSLAIGGVPTVNGLVIPKGSIWESILNIGTAGFTFMVPVLSGYIAMSIADRPGLVPGMVGGYIAATGSFYHSQAGAGFIGGIVAGFMAGYIAKWIKSWKVPRILLPIMPILVIPIISTLLVSSLFVWGIGAPIASLMAGLTHFLNSMQGASGLLLAAILGAMISFDMGGPVNKVAFLFGSSMISQGNPQIMGAIAVAICVPPLGMGVATLLSKKRFSSEELEAGKAALAMGLVGITEGAIPFASKDPLRVIPSIMIGSMAGSIIAMLSGVKDSVPHGGPVIAILEAVANVPMFFVAIAVGVIVTAVMVTLLKSPMKQ